MAQIARAIALALVLSSVAAPGLEAQGNPAPRYRTTTIPGVVVGNALAGGVVASTHALIARRNPFKAFAVGALGGAVHGFGKIMGAGLDSIGIVTNSMSALGTSIVYNGGRGARILDELFIPFGPMRMRLYPYADDRVRFTVNAQELIVLTGTCINVDRRLDRRASIAAGTFVFNSKTPLFSATGPSAGQTNTSVITMAPNAPSPPRTFRHEVVHVQQHWFMVETVDRPIESALRARIPGIRRVPMWIEFGFVTPAIATLERRLTGEDGPYRSLREGEAETLEDQGRIDIMETGSPGSPVPAGIRIKR